MGLEDFPFRFYRGERYFSYKDFAIIGDVHFGKIEGFNIGIKDKFLMEQISSIPFKKLIILGDVRTEFLPSKISERHYLRKIFSELSKEKEILVIKGNHDAKIDEILKGIRKVSVKKQVIIDNIGFLHGHFIPSKYFISRIKILVLAHLHPSISYKDRNGIKYVEDCWQFGEMNIYNKRIDYLIVPKFSIMEGSSEEEEKTGLYKYINSSNKMTLNLQIV